MRSLQAEDPERVGDYAVLGRLGQGAMGVVYLARSPGGRPVAVKVARPELADDPRFRERFRQEVATARAVGGFWTAAVVDADPDATCPWLATEYVPGPTLRDAVTGHGPLPEPGLRRLVAGLAEALAAIHEAGMVHRDLKPSNVLLAADGPRVIDFGIARALEGSGLTATGMLVGTPGFLSPEQIQGGAVTPASDVFALGAVLVYAATGLGPFGEGDAAALVYRAVHARPDLRGVPDGLRALAARCLDPNPKRRPTPAELVADAGRAETAEWLPEPMRAEPVAPEAMRTEPVAPRTDLLPAPTRRYTVLAAPAPVLPPTPPDRPAGTGTRPDSAPHSAPHSAPGNGPGGGNRAVFRTSRRSPAIWGPAAAVAAFACASIAQDASRAGHQTVSLVFAVGFALLGVRAARLLWALARPPRWVEVSASGLTVGRGRRGERLYLTWPQLGRVRVVADRRRPWLVVWPRDPGACGAGLGRRYRRTHGGFGVFPVGHERRRRPREREVRELRAALGWYGPTAHDPSP